MGIGIGAFSWRVSSHMPRSYIAPGGDGMTSATTVMVISLFSALANDCGICCMLQN